jgi:hypothetical protein
MTTPTIPKDTQTSDWQTKYQADRAHDVDNKRRNIMFLTYLLSVLISSIYATAYIWSYYRQQLVARLGILDIWLLITIMNTVTVLAAFFLLYRTASHLFTSLYLREEDNPKTRLALRFFGIPPMPPPLYVFDSMNYPIVMIKDGKVDAKNDWVMWLGGPARLLIFDGNAVYVERGNSFSRILGPANRFPFLDATETVKAVIDLHPQVVIKPDVKGWTKDGIEVQMEVRIECQIGLEGITEATSKGLLYPYGPISVKKAFESVVVRYDREKKCLAEFNWVDRVGGYIEGELSTYVFSHTLDELFLAERGPDQLLSPDVTANWLKEMNKQLINSIGMRVLSLQITDVKPIDETVNEQRVKSWEARKQSAVAISEGKTKAYGILAHEKARAEAERDLIDAIVEGLRSHPTTYSEQLILSLSGILDQSLKDSDYGMYIPGETLESFNKLRDLLHL